MTFDAFKSLCENRRSIRYYGNDPVSKDDILKLLELARHAPSVQNIQPWHFHVILQDTLREQMMQSSYYGNFLLGASAFIVVTCEKNVDLTGKEPIWNPREMEYSCMAAMTTILLGASAMNIGACWVSLTKGNVHELLHLRAEEIVVGGIMLGKYKHDESTPSGAHERRPLKQMYTIHE